MQYSLQFPNMGIYSDVRLLADLARLAEEAGWNGFFLSDTMQYGPEALPTNDPWIALAAIALNTERIKIGLRVAAPPRRRPWKMAREAVTLDHLSNGRLILGVGLGDEHDRAFSAFGEEMDLRKRGKMLDESLDILRGLWSGKPFSYSGEHYHVDEVTFLPPPVQASGIPIWVGWMWPRKKPIERAARFEGADPFAVNADGSYAALTPEEIGQIKRIVDKQRTETEPFDIVASGSVIEAVHNEQAKARLRALAEAGATWCTEFISQFDLDAVRASIRQGPPIL